MSLALRHEIFGIPIDEISRAQVRERFRACLADGGSLFVATPNPEFIVRARHDGAFAQILKRVDLSLPDGIGLRYASAALFGRPLAERVTGVMAFEDLLELCTTEKKRLLILGLESNERRALAVLNIRRAYPELDVEVLDPGFIDPVTPYLPEVHAEQVRVMAPDVVAVALAFGKQEIIAADLVANFPTVKIAIGIGGTVDRWADPSLAAAPAWQRRGFEWLWRLGREPWRYQRIYRAIVVFPFIVAVEAARSRGFFRAAADVWRTLRQDFFNR